MWKRERNCIFVPSQMWKGVTFWRKVEERRSDIHTNLLKGKKKDEFEVKKRGGKAHLAVSSVLVEQTSKLPSPTQFKISTLPSAHCLWTNAAFSFFSSSIQTSLPLLLFSPSTHKPTFMVFSIHFKLCYSEISYFNRFNRYSLMFSLILFVDLPFLNTIILVHSNDHFRVPTTLAKTTFND